MPYIGAGIQRFNTADGLTVSGNATVTGTYLSLAQSTDLERTHLRHRLGVQRLWSVADNTSRQMKVYVISGQRISG